MLSPGSALELTITSRGLGAEQNNLNASVTLNCVYLTVLVIVLSHVLNLVWPSVSMTQA
jgi:hypothetical protein